MKIYSFSGVLPILKMGDGKRYLVLAKRSDDAKTNPGCHSGFFGWANNDKEKSDPEVIAHRELLEEIFIILKDKKKAFNLVFKEKIDLQKHEIKEAKVYTENLIKAWNKEKGLKIEIKKEDISSIIKEPEFEEVEFIDHSGRAKVYILEFNLLLNLSDVCLLDGEADKEFPEIKDLLDREIDVFDLSEFKKWWCENDRGSLNAEISFKTGKPEIIKGFIDRKNKNKISPALVIILNKWLGNC